ncbi:PilN domain-containing protein [Peribacillus sp. SCS-155]|uniref:PilN domain-containing protein n=1 Tax=Peribacillus sedimenti TaxID=3115297 RepID=UPI003906B2FA
MMLVEINLLPKKEPKSFGFMLVMIVIAALSAALATVFYIQYKVQTENVQTLEGQINSTKEIAAIEQQKITDFESSNSAVELENMVTWAKDYPIDTVLVLRQLISLLPERGFLQTFTYSEAGKIGLTVQFDTSTEAANYLSLLNNSKAIKNASLKTLTALEEKMQETENPSAEMQFAMMIQEKLNFLPRYVGTYEITFDKAEIKDMEKDKDKASAEEDGQ